MFISASTKEFTRVNNAFPSHDVASELSILQDVANVYNELDNVFKNKTYSILICESFPFTLVQCFHSNRDGEV